MERNKYCIYYSNCEYEDKNCVKDMCNRGTRIQHLLDSSYIPQNLWRQLQLVPCKGDEEAFSQMKSFCENSAELVRGYKPFSFYLWSENCGNGKTTWGIKFLLNYFHNIWDNYSSFQLPEGMYVNVPEFFLKAKADISNPSKSFNQLMDDLMKARVVVFDDIAIKSATSYEYDLLYVILNHREMEGLCSVFTSNVNPNKLQEYLGNRVCSRILTKYCNCVQLVGRDMR